MSIRFRDATSADLASLVRLDSVCFSPRTRYSTDVMRFFAFHRHSRTIIAMDEQERIAAFIIVHLLRSGIGEVVTIDVEPNYRRQGIAQKLMERGEQWLRQQGARGIFLEVDEGNRAAIALYRKFGYQVRHPFIEDRTRRLLMEKEL